MPHDLHHQEMLSEHPLPGTHVLSCRIFEKICGHIYIVFKEPIAVCKLTDLCSQVIFNYDLSLFGLPLFSFPYPLYFPYSPSIHPLLGFISTNLDPNQWPLNFPCSNATFNWWDNMALSDTYCHFCIPRSRSRHVVLELALQLSSPYTVFA